MNDNPVVGYLREVKAELSKVSWPTRPEAVRLTIIVLVAAVLCGMLIGAVDFGLTRLIAWLLP